jgi:hypothetical protein
MRAGLAAAAVLLGLLVANSALGDGGPSIASAPELPLGQRVEGGALNWCQNPEFWRLTLRRGDHAKLDFSSLNGSTTVLQLYAPSITDYTFSGDGGYITNAGTGGNGKGELRYIAPAPGRYTVFFRTAGECDDALAYDLIGYVQHLTHLTLHGPSVARAHARIKLRGAVAGLNAGKVLAQAKVGRRWKTLRIVTVGAQGNFVFSARVGGPGIRRFRAAFLGDSSHLPSAATCSVRVA